MLKVKMSDDWELLMDIVGSAGCGSPDWKAVSKKLKCAFLAELKR